MLVPDRHLLDNPEGATDNPPDRAPVLQLSPTLSRAILDRLNLAVYVFRASKVGYCNPAAEHLRRRLRASYRIELDVVLRDHLPAVLDRRRADEDEDQRPLVSLMTASTGEPFYVHVIPLPEPDLVAVTVRVIGAEIEAVRSRYRLSARESQVAELVLHGYRNAEIAGALGIAPATTKKHLTRIFDKVGVHTRSQLQTRLA